jgi:hypothetical protein
MTDMPIHARPAVGELSVGQVFARAWEILTANFAQFVAVMAIVAVPNLLLEAQGPSTGGPGWMFAIVLPLSVVLNFVGQAVILYIAFQYLRGQSASLGDSVQKGLTRFFPILGLSILMGLGFLVGAVLLVVPAIILLVVWSVALPACVLERLGPIASLKRSSALTKGHRWKIFGIMLLLWIATLVVITVLGALLFSLGAIALAIGKFLWTTVWAAYYNSVLIMIYHDLRVAKEGVDVEQIASVFD